MGAGDRQQSHSLAHAAASSADMSMRAAKSPRHSDYEYLWLAELLCQQKYLDDYNIAQIRRALEALTYHAGYHNIIEALARPTQTTPHTHYISHIINEYFTVIFQQISKQHLPIATSDTIIVPRSTAKITQALLQLIEDFFEQHPPQHSYTTSSALAQLCTRHLTGSGYEGLKATDAEDAIDTILKSAYQTDATATGPASDDFATLNQTTRCQALSDELKHLIHLLSGHKHFDPQPNLFGLDYNVFHKGQPYLHRAVATLETLQEKLSAPAAAVKNTDTLIDEILTEIHIIQFVIGYRKKHNQEDSEERKKHRELTPQQKKEKKRILQSIHDIVQAKRNSHTIDEARGTNTHSHTSSFSSTTTRSGEAHTTVYRRADTPTSGSEQGDSHSTHGEPFDDDSSLEGIDSAIADYQRRITEIEAALQPYAEKQQQAEASARRSFNAEHLADDAGLTDQHFARTAALQKKLELHMQGLLARSPQAADVKAQDAEATTDAEITALQKVIATQAARLEELEARLKADEQAISAANHVLLAQEDRHTEAEQLHQRTQEQLVEQIETVIAERDALLQQLQQHQATLRIKSQRLDAVDKTTEEQAAEIRALQQAASKKDMAHLGTKAADAAHLQKAKAQIAHLEKQLAEQQHRAEEAATVAQQHEALASTTDDDSYTVTALKRIIQAGIDEKPEAEHALAQAKLDLKRLESEYHHLGLSYDQLLNEHEQQAGEPSPENAHILSAIEEKMRKANRRMQLLSTESKAQAVEIAELKAQLAKAAEENQSLKQNHGEATRALEEIQAIVKHDLAGAAQEIQRLEGKLIRATEKEAEDQKDIQALQAMNANLISEREKLEQTFRKHFTTLQDHGKQLQHQIAMLSQQSSEDKAQIAALEKKLGEVTSAKEQLQHKAKALAERCEQLLESAEDKLQNAQAQQNRFDTDLEAAIIALEKLADETKDDVDLLEQQQQAAHQAALEAKQQAIQLEVQQLEREAARLREAEADAEEHLAWLEEREPPATTTADHGTQVDPEVAEIDTAEPSEHEQQLQQHIAELTDECTALQQQLAKTTDEKKQTIALAKDAIHHADAQATGTENFENALEALLAEAKKDQEELITASLQHEAERHAAEQKQQDEYIAELVDSTISEAAERVALEKQLAEAKQQSDLLHEKFLQQKRLAFSQRKAAKAFATRHAAGGDTPSQSLLDRFDAAAEDDSLAVLRPIIGEYAKAFKTLATQQEVEYKHHHDSLIARIKQLQAEIDKMTPGYLKVQAKQRKKAGIKAPQSPVATYGEVLDSGKVLTDAFHKIGAKATAQVDILTARLAAQYANSTASPPSTPDHEDDTIAQELVFSGSEDEDPEAAQVSTPEPMSTPRSSAGSTASFVVNAGKAQAKRLNLGANSPQDHFSMAAMQSKRVHQSKPT